VFSCYCGSKNCDGKAQKLRAIQSKKIKKNEIYSWNERQRFFPCLHKSRGYVKPNNCGGETGVNLNGKTPLVRDCGSLKIIISIKY
jgi:hypothetical protein